MVGFFIASFGKVVYSDTAMTSLPAPRLYTSSTMLGSQANELVRMLWHGHLASEFVGQSPRCDARSRTEKKLQNKVLHRTSAKRRATCSAISTIFSGTEGVPLKCRWI